MSKVLIKGQRKKVFFSAKSFYGAPVKINVFDDDADEFIAEQVPATEIVHPVTELTATVVGEVAEDAKVLELDNVGDLKPSDRILVDGEIVKCVGIDGNQVQIHRAFGKVIADGTSVERVGNTGMFKIELLVTKAGYFIIQATDTKFGIELSDSITIKEESLEEMLEELNVEVNENENIIRETSTFTIMI